MIFFLWPCIYTAASAELEEEEEEEEFDWEIEQTPYEESAESTLPLHYHYGFGNLRSGVFQRLQVDSFLSFCIVKVLGNFHVG